MALAGCALALACLVGPTPCSATALSFIGARLGMSLAAWRSLAPPEGAGPDALPSCSAGAGTGANAHIPSNTTLRAGGMVTCAYVDRVGDVALPSSFSLDAAYRADNLQFMFDDGRLFEIQFDVSIDAFNAVMSILKHQYGPPTATNRDQVRSPDSRLARVTQIWRTAGGTIMLVDPSDRLTQLEVSLTDIGRAPQVQAMSASSRARQ